jgi:hypothetical protein
MISLKGCRIDKRELSIGRKIEMEHTNNPRVATRIASQHICEFPRYYSKGLIPMEKRLRARA